VNVATLQVTRQSGQQTCGAYVYGIQYVSLEPEKSTVTGLRQQPHEQEGDKLLLTAAATLPIHTQLHTSNPLPLSCHVMLLMTDRPVDVPSVSMCLLCIYKCALPCARQGRAGRGGAGQGSAGDKATRQGFQTSDGLSLPTPLCFGSLSYPAGFGTQVQFDRFSRICQPP
jgi:hypothetical protein